MIIPLPRFLLFLLMFLIQTTDASAFSFGGIEVQSKFGERFKAEVELDVENGDFSVAMGVDEDYERLDLQRPAVIDELKIETPTGKRGSAWLIRITSERPLFFPSFNLLLKATHNGGTILENFVISVDFQRSLALNVKGAKKKEKTPPKQVDLLKAGEAEAGAEIPPTPAREKAVVAEAGRTVASIPREELQAPEIESKRPVPMIGYQTPRSSASGVEGVFPRSIPAHEKDNEEEADEAVQTPAPVIPSARKETVAQAPDLPPVVAQPPVRKTATVQEEPPISVSETEALQRGDTLLSIVEKLNVAPEKLTQTIVALWLDNQEKFIYGNMNGLRVGTSLSLANLENRLANLEFKTAQELLQSQWEEWKLVQKGLQAPTILEGEEGAQEELLPSEESGLGQVFETLRQWQKSWEEKDLDRHVSHFYQGAAGANSESFVAMKNLKRRMFDLHEAVKVLVHNPVLIRTREHLTATFEQGFSSDRIESWGRKDIHLVREGLEWKIIDEVFKVKEFRKKRGASPFTDSKDEAPVFSIKGDSHASFVIHSSSHLDYPTAVRVVNELRKKGLDAYSCPLYLSATRKIYRVYVGRVPDWDQAEALTHQIRSLGVGRLAVSYRAPYAIEVGSYRSEKEAEEKIRALRAKNYSPVLFVRSGDNFSDPEFKVLLGAFSQAERADRIIGDLERLGVSGKLIEP